MAKSKTVSVAAKRLDKEASARIRCGVGFSGITHYDTIAAVHVQFFVYGCRSYAISISGTAGSAYYDPATQIIVISGTTAGEQITLNIRCSDGNCIAASSITFEC